MTFTTSGSTPSLLTVKCPLLCITTGSLKKRKLVEWELAVVEEMKKGGKVISLTNDGALTYVDATPGHGNNRFFIRSGNKNTQRDFFRIKEE